MNSSACGATSTATPSWPSTSTAPRRWWPRSCRPGATKSSAASAAPAWWARLVRGNGTRRLGLRADMDALPIDEATGLPLRQLPRRRDARLRPRRPHGDAAGRGAPPGRAGPLRRHAEPDLPARRGRRRRRAAHDGRRPVRASTRATPSSRCTTCPASRRAGWCCATARPWPRPTTPRSRSPASAATAPCRTARPTRSWRRPAS